MSRSYEGGDTSVGIDFVWRGKPVIDKSRYVGHCRGGREYMLPGGECGKIGRGFTCLHVSEPHNLVEL